MHVKRFCAIVAASVALSSTVQAQYNTQRGAVLGGLTGAAAGAAIGNHNGETAEGALIGSAIGLFSGALLGNSIDAEQSRQQYLRQQQYQHYMAQNSRAVTVSEILSMTRSGVSDGVIINHINQHGVQQRLEVADVILLHQQGVSEPVLTALQRARVGGEPVYAAPARTYSTPVIVHDYHYVRPAYPVVAPPYCRPHYHPHHPRQHVRFGISVGH